MKPHGAIFINSFSNTSSSVDIDYTIIANEISLYLVRDFSFKEEVGSSSVEVQRRLDSIVIIIVMIDDLFSGIHS